MSPLNVVYDTRDVFHGRNVFGTWKKEHFWWDRTTSNQDYEFPPLERSKYENQANIAALNSHIDFESSTICLGLTWSLDGTSLVAVFNDYGIRQYLLPEEPGTMLVPFKRFFRSQSIVESCVHPLYSMFGGNEGINVMLISSKELPIQLVSLSPQVSEHTPLFSYSVLNEENEKYETIFALSFYRESQFLAGASRNKVLAYDLNRKCPLWSSSISGGSRKDKGNNQFTHRSIVSCFDQNNGVQPFSVSYGATYRNDIFGVDTRIKHLLSLADKNTLGINNTSGIVQLISSVNQHFLYVVKRNSDTIDILDIRQGLSKINELKLPFRIGAQKFKASVDSTNGLLIGTADGRILKWSSDLIEFGGIAKENSPILEDCLKPNIDFQTEYLEYRINIVATNPWNPHIIASSYSPDKFDTDQEAKSGISVFSLQ
ncbi:LAME_0F16578g1_1 [Lachancea meyersii CBS 8951]|uniref:LAME_0F16578g1_1 n=1 Tax=Lachancea meyersii CBS 8951 TaxID=1266667 RepID=A0A1G4JZA4_9SACH|nr:LAME_0F16578g1_1 [Lachancea meyersii CBS 8951]